LRSIDQSHIIFT